MKNTNTKKAARREDDTRASSARNANYFNDPYLGNSLVPMPASAERVESEWIREAYVQQRCRAKKSH